MANQSITFTIGSTFQGQGFQAAKNAVGQLSKDMRQAAGVASQIAGAMTGMDSSAAKAASAIAGLMQAVSTGNPIMIGMQAVMTAAGVIMADYKDACKEAEEEQKKLNESLKRLKETQDKIWTQQLTQNIQGVIDKMSKLTERFEKATENARKFKSAVDGVQSAKDESAILALQVEKAKAVQGASANDKSAVSARYDKLIQEEKNRQNAARASANVTTAEEAIATNEYRKNSLKNQGVELSIQELNLKNRLTAEKDKSKRDELQKQLERVRTAKSKVSSEYVNAQSNSKILSQELERAKIEQTNAAYQATIDSIGADEAVSKADTVRQGVSTSSGISSSSSVNERYSRLLRESLEAQKEAEKYRAEFSKARKDYESSQAKLRSDYFAGDDNGVSKMIQDAVSQGIDPNSSILLGAGRNVTANGILGEVFKNDVNTGRLGASGIGGDISGAISRRAAQNAVDRAIASGVTDMKSLEKIRRNALQDARVQLSKETNAAKRDKQKSDRLSKIDPDKLSAKDRQWLADYEASHKGASSDAENELAGKADVAKRKQDLADYKKRIAEQAKDDDEKRKNTKENAKESAKQHSNSISLNWQDVVDLKDYTKEIRDKLKNLGLK